MPGVLSQLLSADEPLFSHAIEQLEKASGHRGTDAKLIGDIARHFTRVIEGFGLDPRDTTGHELYASLLARVHDDNTRVATKLGARDPDDVADMLPRIIEAVHSMKIPKSCWAMKYDAAREFMRRMPPQKLMQHLGYESIDDLLQNEPLEEVYVALRFSEGPEWLKEYNTLLRSLTPDDFESREITIVQMNHHKYVTLAEHFVEKKLHNVTHSKEMGIITLVPMHATRSRGITLKTLPLLLHYINEIRLYSTFFKLKQSKEDFGNIVVETLNADPRTASQMAGNYVHWRVIQRYYGKLKDEAHPEAFQPHVQPEDLHWRHVEDQLAEYDDVMKFWLETDYVGKIETDGPLTLNFMDISLSYANNIPYDERYTYHFRESLWNEIFARYMGHQNLENQILKQLDNSLIAPENIKK